MQKLGVSPEETIIVEDSPHWIEAAKASGAQVITVNNATEVHSWIFSHIL
jgi:beta-phosphoglucomutase-like phosphatase (HAD superfamily)